MKNHFNGFPVLVFSVFFLCVPILNLKWLAEIPGDTGDARFNNIILESIYKFLNGEIESIWNLPFFFPYPYVLGFSDNLFGTAPIYVVIRCFDISPATSFQLWFLAGYVANFFSAYWSIRKLKLSITGATVGGLIFAFALPTTAHAGHAQLHFRFGIPLCIVFFADFLFKKEWNYFLISFFWLSWQLFAGIYMGIFTLIFMILMLLEMIAFQFFRKRLVYELNSFFKAVLFMKRKEKAYLFLKFGLIFGLILVFIYPYFRVSEIYGFRRKWPEISLMLPRIESYFFSDVSLIWSSLNLNPATGLAMSWEHQMFTGIIPTFLVFYSIIISLFYLNNKFLFLMLGTIFSIVGLTVYIDGFSFWEYICIFPPLSAIRAVTRLDQVLLFPIAYLCAISVEDIHRRFCVCDKYRVVFLALLLVEFSAVSMPASSKMIWISHDNATERRINKTINSDSILFFSQQKDMPIATSELDSMWAALRHRAKSLNGYSGWLPVGYHENFGSDCTEIPRRIESYLAFSGHENDLELYRKLISRVIPIGFDNCENLWTNHMLPKTTSFRDYSAGEIRSIGYSVAIKNTFSGTQYVVRVFNRSKNNFSAISNIGHPIRLSWRFLNGNGKPLSAWDTRVDLPMDIPPHGQIEVFLPITIPSKSEIKYVEVSMVQEFVFWAHDVGVETAKLFIE